MDDLVWWGDSRSAVRAGAWMHAGTYAAERLDARRSSSLVSGRTQRQGLVLCGYRILPGRLLLVAAAQAPLRRVPAALGETSTLPADRCADAAGGLAAVLGITLHADATAWRRGAVTPRAGCTGPGRRCNVAGSGGSKTGANRVIRGGLLEQQRAQLPLREPQQERARQPQQQPRLPLCPSSRPGQRRAAEQTPAGAQSRRNQSPPVC